MVDWLGGVCTITADWGGRVTGASTVGGWNCSALLSGSLGHNHLLQPGGQHCIDCLTSYLVLWSCGLSWEGSGWRNWHLLFPLSRLLCLLVHPPLEGQLCGMLCCPCVLDKDTFELWMFTVCDWRKETKGTSHIVMMLTSLLKSIY